MQCSEHPQELAAAQFGRRAEHSPEFPRHNAQMEAAGMADVAQPGTAEFVQLYLGFFMTLSKEQCWTSLCAQSIIINGLLFHN